MTASGKHLVFIRKDIQLAVPIEHVSELIHVASFLPCYGNLPGCAGNMEYQDHFLPVFDPAAMLRGEGDAAEGEIHDAVIIIRYKKNLFGLMMDRFVAPIALNREDAGSDTEIGLKNENNGVIESVIGFSGRNLIVLHLPAVARMVQQVFKDQRCMAKAREDHTGAPLDDKKYDTGQNRENILCGNIGPHLLGIPVENIFEVIEGCEISPLFHVDAALRGLINLRGQVVACFDVSDALGMPLRDLGETSRFVVLKDGNAELALCFDSVSKIRKIPFSGIAATEGILCGEIKDYVSGIYEETGQRILILSVSRVFLSRRLARLRQASG